MRQPFRREEGRPPQPPLPLFSSAKRRLGLRSAAAVADELVLAEEPANLSLGSICPVPPHFFQGSGAWDGFGGIGAEATQWPPASGLQGDRLSKHPVGALPPRRGGRYRRDSASRSGLPGSRQPASGGSQRLSRTVSPEKRAGGPMNRPQ
jgi:hypothetical protein